MSNDSKSPQGKFLGAFRGEMKSTIIEFGKQLWEKDSDIYIFMARKASCFFDCLRELKIADVRGLALSDRILDMDLSFLKGKRITLVDDCVFSGTTLYHARDVVKKAGASECDTMAITVNEDWIRPMLLPNGAEANDLNFVSPLFKQNDSKCVQQCYDIVQAISIFPRPYDVDFPHTLASKISNDELDNLLKCFGWQAYDVSTSFQVSNDVRTFTVIPNQHVFRGFVDAYKGLSSNIQLAKIRIYAKKLSETSWSIRLVPIIMLGAIESSMLIGENNIFLEDFDKKLSYLGANTGSSRYRLLHFLVSWALLRHYVRLVKERSGVYVKEQLRYDLAEMTFGHNFAGLSVELLKLLRSLDFPLPANEPESFFSLQFGKEVIDVDNSQEILSNCLEPFVWLYNKLEIPARKMVLEKGLKECVRDNNNLTRLRRGFSPQRLMTRLKSQSIDVPRYVSLFLDKAIDLGIAVPTMVEDSGILYRALRHGEDAVYGEAQERLSIIALKAYMESRGISSIYSLELQKFIVLFVQIAVRDGSLLERLNSSESVDIGCRIISIKGHLHGPVPMLTTLDESGAVGAPYVQGNDYPAEWLIREWENNEILEVERGGSKKFDKSDFKKSDLFFKRLANRKDPISKDIYQELEPAAKSIVDGWLEGMLISDDILELIAKNINSYAGKKLIWDPDVFDGVRLREITKNALKYHRASFDIYRVNRLLIEDAYPKVFKNSVGGTRYSIKNVPDLQIGLRKESHARKIGRCLGRLVGDKSVTNNRKLNNDTDLVLLSTCSEAEHQIRALSGELSIIRERWSQTLDLVRAYARNKEYSEASNILLSNNSLFMSINSGGMKYLWFVSNRMEKLINNVSEYAEIIDPSGDLKDDWLMLWPEFVSPTQSNTSPVLWDSIMKMGRWLVSINIIIRIIVYWLILSAEENGEDVVKKSEDVLSDCVFWCDIYKEYISHQFRSHFGQMVNQILNLKSGAKISVVEELCKKVSEYINQEGMHEIRLLLSDSKLLCDGYGSLGEFRPYQYALFVDIESSGFDSDPYVKQIRMVSNLMSDDMRLIENNHNPWRSGLWIIMRGNNSDMKAVEMCYEIVRYCNKERLRFRMVVVGQLSYEDSIRDMSGSIKLSGGDFYRRISSLKKNVLPSGYQNRIVFVSEATGAPLSEGQKYCKIASIKDYSFRTVNSSGEGLPEKKFIVSDVDVSISNSMRPLKYKIQKRKYKAQNNNIIINNITKQEGIMEKHVHQYGGGDNFAGDKVMRDKIGTQIVYEQDIVQAAKDIKELLKQITLDNPDDSKRVLSAKAIDKIIEKPELKARLIRGVKAGSLAALEKAIDHPLAQFFVEGIKEAFK